VYSCTPALTYLLNPYSRVLLEKLTISQLVKKFPAFYGTLEPEGSLPHSQVPATCPYPEPAQSSPYPHILNIHLNIILPSMPGSPQWSLSFRFPHQNPAHTSLLPPYVLHAPPISLFSISSPAQQALLQSNSTVEAPTPHKHTILSHYMNR
jgi:hypothetical protein